MGPCSIDWAAAGSWAQAAAGLAGAWAVMWVGKKGAETFGTWLQQKQTERQMDAADRLLTLVYKVERAFPGIRNPISYQGEISAALILLREQFPDFDRLDAGRRQRLQQAQISLTRLKSQSALWDELNAGMPSAKAYFGERGQEVLNKLWRAVVKIQTAAQLYPDADHEHASRLEADFWSDWGKVAHGVDEVEDLITAAVAEAEALLLPVLRSHLGVLGSATR